MAVTAADTGFFKYISFHSFKPETRQRVLQMGGSFEMKFNINGLNHVTLLVGQYCFCSNSAKCKMHSSLFCLLQHYLILQMHSHFSLSMCAAKVKAFSMLNSIQIWPL